MNPRFPQDIWAAGRLFGQKVPSLLTSTRCSLLLGVIFISVVVGSARRNSHFPGSLGQPLAAIVSVMGGAKNIAVLGLGVDINSARLVRQPLKLRVGDRMIELCRTHGDFLCGHEGRSAFESKIIGWSCIRRAIGETIAENFNIDSVFRVPGWSITEILHSYSYGKRNVRLNVSDILGSGGIDHNSQKPYPGSLRVQQLLLGSIELEAIDEDARNADSRKNSIENKQALIKSGYGVILIVLGVIVGIGAHFFLLYDGYSHWPLTKRLLLGLGGWAVASLLLFQGINLLVNVPGVP